MAVPREGERQRTPGLRRRTDPASRRSAWPPGATGTTVSAVPPPSATASPPGEAQEEDLVPGRPDDLSGPEHAPRLLQGGSRQSRMRSIPSSRIPASASRGASSAQPSPRARTSSAAVRSSRVRREARRGSSRVAGRRGSAGAGASSARLARRLPRPPAPPSGGRRPGPPPWRSRRAARGWSWRRPRPPRPRPGGAEGGGGRRPPRAEAGGEHRGGLVLRVRRARLGARVRLRGSAGHPEERPEEGRLRVFGSRREASVQGRTLQGTRYSRPARPSGQARARGAGEGGAPAGGGTDVSPR